MAPPLTGKSLILRPPTEGERAPERFYCVGRTVALSLTPEEDLLVHSLVFPVYHRR